MKVLLDECIPRKLKAAFVGHQCSTVPEAGLAGKKNGDLLSLAEIQGFEIFLTMDKGIQYEQNLTDRRIAIIIVRAKSNRLGDLMQMPVLHTCALFDRDKLFWLASRRQRTSPPP